MHTAYEAAAQAVLDADRASKMAKDREHEETMRTIFAIEPFRSVDRVVEIGATLTPTFDTFMREVHEYRASFARDAAYRVIGIDLGFGPNDTCITWVGKSGDAIRMLDTDRYDPWEGVVREMVSPTGMGLWIPKAPSAAMNTSIMHHPSLKVGDVVMHKNKNISTVPMTVDKLRSAGPSAECTWFDGNTARNWVFPIDELELVQPVSTPVPTLKSPPQYPAINPPPTTGYDSLVVCGVCGAASNYARNDHRKRCYDCAEAGK
jgi:uncharacterized protein YodC (DUF2158 family)